MERLHTILQAISPHLHRHRLAASTEYMAPITNAATDLVGNALAAGVAPNPWSFTTVPPPAQRGLRLEPLRRLKQLEAEAG